MAIYNNADGDFIISELVRAKVHYDGRVTWRPPIISKTFCEIRVADFPFDTQNCTLKIGTWTHNQFMVNIMSFNQTFNNNVSCCQSPDLRWIIQKEFEVLCQPNLNVKFSALTNKMANGSFEKLAAGNTMWNIHVVQRFTWIPLITWVSF